MILLNKFLADERGIFDAVDTLCISMPSFLASFIKRSSHAMTEYIRTYKTYVTYTYMDRRYRLWDKGYCDVEIYIDFSSTMSITVEIGCLFLKSKDYSGTFEDFINELINEYKIYLEFDM